MQLRKKLMSAAEKEGLVQLRKITEIDNGSNKLLRVPRWNRTS